MDLTSVSQSATQDKPAEKQKDLETSVKARSDSGSSPGMATIQDDDERLLARIGYKQVCRGHPPTSEQAV
jgi:hypothetical protein